MSGSDVSADGGPNLPVSRGSGAAALIASVLAMILTGVFLCCRAGLPDHQFRPAILSLGLSWYLVHFPFAFKTLLWRNSKRQNSWLRSDGALAIVGLASAIGLSWVGWPAGVAVAVLGGLFLTARLARVANSRPRVGELFVGALGVSLLGLGLAGVTWGSSFLHPCFVELMSKGKPRIDPLFHACNANMIRTYGVPGTGLDGLVFAPSHFGSHFLAARLSDMLGISVVTFYQTTFPITFLAFLLYAVCTAGHAFACARGDSAKLGVRFWAVLLFGVLGFVPDEGIFIPTVWNGGTWLTSESYIMAITVLLLAVAVIRPVLVTWNETRASATGLAVAVALTTVALLLLKISVGALFLAGACYVALRFIVLWRTIAPAAVIVLGAIAFFLTLPLVHAPGYQSLASGVNPASYHFVGIIRFPLWSFYFLLEYFWLGVAVYSWATVQGIRTLGEMAAAVRSGRWIDLEFVVVVAAVGLAVPVLLPTGAAGAGVYFLTVQHWLAVPVVLGAVARRPTPQVTPRHPGAFRLGSVPLGSLALGLLIVSALWSQTLNTLHRLYSAGDDALMACGVPPLVPNQHESPRERLKRLAGSGRMSEFIDLLRAAHSDDARENSRRAVIDSLRALDEWPQSEKRRTVLYIPRTNQTYWGMFPEPGVESEPLKSTPFLAPALSGLTMLEGLPELPDGERYADYSYLTYPLAPPRPPGPPASRKDELCARAAALGFARVVVFDSRSDGTPHLIEWRLADVPPLLAPPGGK